MRNDRGTRRAVGPFILFAILATFLSIRSAAACDPLQEWCNQDIGSPSPTGSFTNSSGPFVVRAGGDENARFNTGWELAPGQTSDAFHFVYKQKTGDFEIIAQITNVTTDDPDTQNTGLSGLMIRDSLAPDARHGFVFRVDPNNVNDRCFHHWRAWPGDPEKAESATPVVGADPYLRLVRYKDQIVAYCRKQPSDDWQWVDGTTLNGLATTLYVGLAVTSGSSVSDLRYTPVTATFENVSVAAFTPPYTTSWIGNSLPGGRTHIPQDISAMFVDADGQIYTNAVWEEGTSESTVLDSNGNVIRKLEYTHGIHLGGHAVTANGSHVYLAMRQDSVQQPGGCGSIDPALSRNHTSDPEATGPWCDPANDDPTTPNYDERSLLNGSLCTAAQSSAPCCCADLDFPKCSGETWYAIRRYSKTTGEPSPVPNGDGLGGSMRVVSKTGDVRGLAFVGTNLYASDSGANCIRVYDANLQHLSNDEDGCTAPDFPVARPRALAKGTQSYLLWIIQDADPSNPWQSPARVTKWNVLTGEKLSGEISTALTPTALAVASNGKIWVADDGPDQRIKIYNSNGSQTDTFGAQYGIYSGIKGQAQPTKFNGPVGIGFDGQGNIYVACDGPDVGLGGKTAGSQEQGTGTELRKFTPQRQLVWEKYALEFVDTTDADPSSNGVDLFTKETHYVMDYTKPAGQEWTYKGLTLDRFSYPHDGRLFEKRSGYEGVIVRRIGGQRIMFTTTHYGNYLGIYRFDPTSEIAIPSGLLMNQPPRGDQINNWPFNLPCTCNGLSCEPPVEWDTIACNAPVHNSLLNCIDRYVWRDTNGNGLMDHNPSSHLEYFRDAGAQGELWAWSVDEAGDIWSASRRSLPSEPLPIRRYRFKGFDSYNNPKYYGTNIAPCPDGNCVEEFAVPSEFGSPGGECPGPCTGVMRAHYVPATDTMYLSGFTPANPKEELEDNATALGTELIRYDNWHGNRAVAWRITLPYLRTPPYDYVAKSMNVAGEKLFVAVQNPAEVRVYNACSGTFLQSFKPGAEVAGESAWIISQQGMNAIKRTNGEYRIFTGELVGSKVLMYRSPPLNPPLCQQTYCTGVEIGCQATGTYGDCMGCCNYTCGVYLPQCIDAECPPNVCGGCGGQ